jgi:hypothetical protein
MKFYAFLFLALLSVDYSYPKFSNNGTFKSRSSFLTADVLENNGTIEGVDIVNLKCDKLIGNGLIKGPKVIIFAKEFLYLGQIDCSGDCTIFTDTPRKELKFKFTGSGSLVVKLTKDYTGN